MTHFGNRLMNSIDIVPRGLGTAGSGALDLVSAPLYGALNFSERMGKRSQDIKEAVKNAINTGPNWKRWIRRPLAYVTGFGSYLTGLVRSLAASSRDTVGYIFKALGNTFNNAGTAVMRLGEPTPPKSFSFAKLEPETTTMDSYLPGRFPALTTA